MSAIVYEMSLNDMVTGKLHQADKAAEHLEGTMHHAAHTMADFGKELIGALGVGFAIFKGVEFVHEGVEAMHALHEAEGQVRAGLESTHEAAGVTFEDMEHDAKSLAGQFKATRAEIFDMQSQLLTFPTISKSVFPETEQAILDMSTRLHKGFNEVAIMVGKALQDPERGITALRRVGVNFNEHQTEVIKKMVETGHIGQAQVAILKELNTEFAGSAKAAADADPLFRFNKIMGSIKMEVGELAMELLHNLQPALEWIAGAFKSTLEWMKEHAELLKYICIAVGVAAAIYGGYLIVVNSISIATKVWTGIQWLLNAALTANPIGIVIVAIGAMVSAVIYCYKHFAKFRATLWGTWALIKEFGKIVSDTFTGLWHVIHGAFTLDKKEISDGLMQAADATMNAGKRLGDAFVKGYEGGMADFAKDEAAEKEANAPKVIKKAVGAITPEATGKKETAKATGNKSVNIHIKIDNLIKDFSFNVKNIKEGMNDAKAAVVQTLLSAVNDSQIIAGQ